MASSQTCAAAASPPDAVPGARRGDAFAARTGGSRLAPAVAQRLLRSRASREQGAGRWFLGTEADPLGRRLDHACNSGCARPRGSVRRKDACRIGQSQVGSCRFGPGRCDLLHTDARHFRLPHPRQSGPVLRRVDSRRHGGAALGFAGSSRAALVSSRRPAAAADPWNRRTGERARCAWAEAGGRDRMGGVRQARPEARTTPAARRPGRCEFPAHRSRRRLCTEISSWTTWDWAVRECCG